MEYLIVEAKDKAINLQTAVNQYIQEGWTPIGGVAVEYSTHSRYWWYYQAMIRESDAAAD